MDDTVLERHKDIQNETFESKLDESKVSLDQSNYSDSSDEDNVIITVAESTKKYDDSNSKYRTDKSEGDISKSDSMIPLVGDSILAQDITTDI